jgi:hypothetical protein
LGAIEAKQRERWIRSLSQERCLMGRPKTSFRRRDLLRLAIAGTAAAAAVAAVPEPASAAPVDLRAKRKARYQANSPEVKDFYRVNKYPAR